MPLVGAWFKVWIYLGFVFGWTKAARPRFDTSTDMRLVLVPADAEVDSVIFRLRATDEDADFPLVFEVTATITPIVRIENLPCTLYNKVCQANVILTKRLIPERLHDFAVRVRDTKGDSNSMQATISVTNATTPRDKIFPHIPSLIMVPEDTKPGKELDYLLVRANIRSGKPVYIELWQPKELFTIRQRQTPTQTRGVITLIGELDFETQSMHTLTMYATDPYTEPGKDTRNIAGLNVVVVVQDVQDVPPIFTLAPPLTKINNSVQPGDVILRVHAEDGDKGVPREITYGLVSEGNPFTPFFNISETTGEIVLARPLEELTQITHVGAPVVLTVVAEEIRRSTEEPPAQATVVDVGFLLGEPGNSPPYFESDTYVATIDENLEPGTIIIFPEQYSTRVRDEDIGKAGVFALKLENNNGTFEINPTVAERTADFIITVRDNTLIDYEMYKSLVFKIVAQEVGPATNLSASAPVTIFLRDVNDNPPVFDEESYEVTLSENVTAGTRVVQVHATDKDTGIFGSIQYTRITGEGSEAFTLNPDTGLITVAMGSSLDREIASQLQLSVEARDENGKGNRGVVPLIVNLLDVNDNAPVFEKDVYEFTLNSDLTNFTAPAVIKATDADAEPPNNVVRYEIIHGNYENKFYLDEVTGELILRTPITKVRRKKQNYESLVKQSKEFVQGPREIPKVTRLNATHDHNRTNLFNRTKRASEDPLYTLTARAYDLGVPHLSSVTQIRIVRGAAMEARIVMFVVPGEHPDSAKTAETLAAITGGRVTVEEIRPYVQNQTEGSPTNGVSGGGKKSIIVARVEQTSPGTPLVDIEKIRETLAANGVGIIGGTNTVTVTMTDPTKPPVNGGGHSSDHNTQINNTITSVHEEVTVYKAENKLLFWLLIILGLLMLLAIAALIVCCICPGCPFYMAPRKRRVRSSETLLVRSDGRPKRHLHRKQAAVADTTWNGRKQAWSADPSRRNWQFNRRNTKNYGLASLPGDVAYVSGQQHDEQMETLRHRDGSIYDHSRRSRMDEQERMYVEDVEAQKVRGYDAADMDSLQRHELERGSDAARQGYRQRYVDADANEETTVREQHFYREGNAEVLRLVTRGQVEDSPITHHHQPTTVVVDGKDILLRRFMEDQKSRHDLSMQDLEAARSMESHQRQKDVCPQQEIILVPDRLDLGHRQHVEELRSNVQRLVIDHGDYEAQKMEGKEREGSLRQEAMIQAGPEKPSAVKEQMQSANVQTFSFHDLELARQNVLLTRLLLERESRPTGGVMDTTSYLETQSLPGQVAIATQTDRTAATQTERHVRSRSDNDESDEDAKYRRKFKSKKRYEYDPRRTRTLWMKSPIEEEGSPCFDKRLSILRKKVKEVKEGRKIAIEPEVLREISDSLDGNGSSYKGEEEESKMYEKSMKETNIKYKVLNEEENGSPSSMEMRRGKYGRAFDRTYEQMTDDRKRDVTESTTSPEARMEHEKFGARTEERSPRKESKTKVESLVKPSFRILEREITMLTKKLSKIGDKRMQESTSDSVNDKFTTSSDSKNDVDHKRSKRPDDSSSRTQQSFGESVPCTSKAPEQTASQRKEAAIAKSRQKLKYQHTQVISTGSSDDAFDKPKKQEGKPKQTVCHAKPKRQTQVERREHKKQTTSEEQETEKRRDVTKEISSSESKYEKTGKISSRTQKVSTSRKENVSEEFSTSTSSDQVEGKKSVFRRDSSKRSSTDSSGTTLGRSSRSKSKKLQGAKKDPDGHTKKEVMERQMAIDIQQDIKEEEEEKESVVDKSLPDSQKSPETIDTTTQPALDVKRHGPRKSIEEIGRTVSLKEAYKNPIDFDNIPKGHVEQQISNSDQEVSVLESTLNGEKIVTEEKLHAQEKGSRSSTSKSDSERELADKLKMCEEEDELTADKIGRVQDTTEDAVQKTEETLQHLQQTEPSVTKTEEQENQIDDLEPSDKERLQDDRRDMKYLDQKMIEEERRQSTKQEYSDQSESCVQQDAERKGIEIPAEHKDGERLPSDIERKITDTKDTFIQQEKLAASDNTEIEVQDEETNSVKHDELRSDIKTETGKESTDVSQKDTKVLDEEVRSKREIREKTEDAVSTDQELHEDKAKTHQEIQEAQQVAIKSATDLSDAQQFPLDTSIGKTLLSPSVESTVKTDITESSYPQLQSEVSGNQNDTVTRRPESEEKSDTEHKTTISTEHEVLSQQPEDKTHKDGEVSKDMFTETDEFSEPKMSSLTEPPPALEIEETDKPKEQHELEDKPLQPEETTKPEQQNVDEKEHKTDEKSEEPSSKQESDQILEKSDEVTEKKDIVPAEVLETEDKRDQAEKDQCTVSFPIITNIIHTPDDSDESDSSSDVSRKTALNVGPYRTPRHQPRKSLETENLEIQSSGTQFPDDSEEMKLTIEMTDKSDESLPKDGETARSPDVSITRIIMTEPVLMLEESAADAVSEQLGTITDTLFPTQEIILMGDNLKPDKTKEQSNPKEKEVLKDTSRSKDLNHKEDKPKGSRTDKKTLKEESSSEKVTRINPATGAKKKRQTSKTPPRKEIAQEKLDSPDKTRRPRSQKPSEVDQGRPKEVDKTKHSRKKDEEVQRKPSKPKSDKESRPGGEIDVSKTQSKYMSWYKKDQEEMERRRMERKLEEDEEQLPRWLRKRRAMEEKKKTPETTPLTRRKVKPLVNVESEQLKAIVRQGRKLRKAEGGQNEDPPVQIFASTPPANVPDTRHHLVQHSEYKYEKVPAPFYLHPPPPPHPSPQLSPERFESQLTSECRIPEDDLDSGIAISMQGGTRLRHQQLLEKKSVFDIAYSEAAPSQLRSDSATPPS